MVDNINLDSINERLSKLERSNRMLRKTVIALSLVLIVVPILGWQVTTQFFKVIETEKLVLKDSKGKERAVLQVDSDSKEVLGPSLKFYDKNHKETFSVETYDNSGPSLTMSIDGLEAVNLYTFGKAGSNLLFKNSENETPYLALGTGFQIGTGVLLPYLNIRNSNNEQYQTTINADEIKTNGQIYASSKDGEQSTKIFDGAILLTDKKGVNRIVMIAENESKNTVITLQSNTNGKSVDRTSLIYGPNYNGLYISDHKGNLRTAIGTTSTQNNQGQSVYHPESSIWMFDEYGNGVFTAPN